MHRLFFGIFGAILLQDLSAAQQEILHELPGLRNLMHHSDDVYSGSEPVSEEAFASLKSLGVKTIVSVDGATPDIDMAMKYGIGYVHVPFGYDTIPLTAQLSLTHAARRS